MLQFILSIVDDDDRDFVEKIYLNYEKKLKIIASRYLSNSQDVDDCVQETIVKVIDNIDKFKLAKSKGYLDRLVTVVCRNCAFNMEKDRSRRNQKERALVRYNELDEQYEDLEIIDYNAFVDKLYISEQNCDYLKDLIDKLDDKYRDVILLKCLGFDTKGIAEIMDISETLVRKRYSRAKKQLWDMGGKDLYVE